MKINDLHDGRFEIDIIDYIESCEDMESFKGLSLEDFVSYLMEKYKDEFSDIVKTIINEQKSNCRSNTDIETDESVIIYPINSIRDVIGISLLIYADFYNKPSNSWLEVSHYKELDSIGEYTIEFVLKGEHINPLYQYHTMCDLSYDLFVSNSIFLSLNLTFKADNETKNTYYGVSIGQSLYFKTSKNRITKFGFVINGRIDYDSF